MRLCNFTIRCLFSLIISKSAAVKATTITMSPRHNEKEGDVFCNTGLTSHYTARSPTTAQALEMQCCTSSSSQNGYPTSASGFKWLNILNYVLGQFIQHYLWSSVCHYKVTLNQYNNTYVLKLQLKIMHIYSISMQCLSTALLQLKWWFIYYCYAQFCGYSTTKPTRWKQWEILYSAKLESDFTEQRVK